MRIELRFLMADAHANGTGSRIGATFQRVGLLLETAALFVGFPLLYYYDLQPLHPIAAVVLIGLFAAAVLLFDKEFDRRVLWESRTLGEHLPSVLAIFLPAAMVIVIGVYWWNPANFLYLPLHHPAIWLMILVLYPLHSVYPQELIFRSFFFHRYRHVFGHGWPMILASAVTFAFMHVVFKNWLAIAFTFAGGILFAWRYKTTRSLLVASLEHSLYGLLMFTIGLDQFFHKATRDLVLKSGW